MAVSSEYCNVVTFGNIFTGLAGKLQRYRTNELSERVREAR